MKKFFISLLILIIAAGVVFYFGWVQIEIPPEHYAVIFTKTGGYDAKPVKPGEFTWRWEKLFPTNMTIYTFPLQSRTTDITITGSLPSSNVYATVLQDGDDFSYTIILSVTYKLNPDTLPELIREGNVTAGSAETVFEAMENSASSVVSRYLYTALAENNQLYNLIDDLEEILSVEFPAIEFQSIHPTTIVFPDIDLYLSAKKTYLNLLETKNRILAEETERAAISNALSAGRLDNLRQYGELLTEYPIILEYLELGLDSESLFDGLGVQKEE